MIRRAIGGNKPERLLLFRFADSLYLDVIKASYSGRSKKPDSNNALPRGMRHANGSALREPILGASMRPQQVKPQFFSFLVKERYRSNRKIIATRADNNILT